jgi:hypothetical protein
MTRHRPTDVAAEAQRYLAAVAVFRAEGREPRWRPEPGARPRRLVIARPLSAVLLDATPHGER